MPFTVVLDACVLYPLPLRDTLLRAAEHRLFSPRWSNQILDEAGRNLIADRRADAEQTWNLTDAIRRAFPDAEVPEALVATYARDMTNEPADRHVLAAAVADKDAQTLVTFNLRHFPAAVCEPLGIAVIHPDDFLCDLYRSSPAQIRAVLDEQAAALSRPAMTVDDVLDRLRDGVPEFVSRVRAAP